MFLLFWAEVRELGFTGCLARRSAVGPGAMSFPHPNCITAPHRNVLPPNRLRTVHQANMIGSRPLGGQNVRPWT
jgi:hypothetical protein